MGREGVGYNFPRIGIESNLGRLQRGKCQVCGRQGFKHLILGFIDM